jgi:hypothetical protein
LKHYKAWFDEECSKLSDQRKQAKLQWLQNPHQTAGDNLNSVKMCNQWKFSGTKRGSIRKKKINELETNSKNKNVGDI